MNHVEERFLNEVVSLSRRLPPSTLLYVCTALSQLPPQSTSTARAQLGQLVIPNEPRQAWLQVLDSWQKNLPGMSPGELAWALRAANAMHQWHRDHQTIELVWTGPLSDDATFRRTDQALLHVINVAQHSLWLVTFAAYKVPQIATALQNAADRGVRISFIAESSEESSAMTWGAIEAIGGSLPRHTQLYIWPKDKRPKNSAGQQGALHAKCAVADERVALISSANLTAHALNLNMELGTLITGSDVPRDLASHLQQLVQQKVVELVSR